MRANSEQITSVAFYPGYYVHVREGAPVLCFLIKQITYNLTRPFWKASNVHLQLAGQQCCLAIWFSSVLWGMTVNISPGGDSWEVRNKKGPRPFGLASQSQCIPFKPSKPLPPSGSSVTVFFKSPVRDSTASQGNFENQNQRLRVLWKCIR